MLQILCVGHSILVRYGNWTNINWTVSKFTISNNIHSGVNTRVQEKLLTSGPVC